MFTPGALLPLLVAWWAPLVLLILVAIASLALALLGALAAAAVRQYGAALRVLFWGALAMALTSLIGRLFGVI